MKKNEVIQKIFNALIEKGYNDDKYNEVMGYTRDKFNNPIYVKKLDINNVHKFDSVAITAVNENFEDACTADIRVAYNDRKVGKRVFVWANELDTDTLIKIYDSIIYTYYRFSTIGIINMLREAISLAGDGGPTPFTDEEYEAMYNFLDNCENIFK